MTNNLSLYIHIPFCVKKCDYCAFYSLANQSEDIKQKYFEALIRQIGFFETDRPIGSVYFGGGTPPTLGVGRLCKLIDFISTRFKLTSDCEITVEVNPGTVDKSSLEALKSVGANRLSIGIQAADDAVLRSIGRIHSIEQAKQCVADARSVGFKNISADIIFALPNQTVETFTKGVYDVMSTDVDHISAYSLQLEEGTPLFERRQTLCFPDEESEERQYEALCRVLTENGFKHYEISSFCKDGFESRHNMNYWARGEYFGFGAGAHSFIFGKRFSALADVDEFIEKSCVSLLAPTDFDDAELISDGEAEEERVMLGLRTSRGAIVPQRSFDAAKKIAMLGYGTFENGILSLNSKGFRVSNEIIAEILI